MTYSHLQNRAMARKLEAGECIDLSENAQISTGYYHLTSGQAWQAEHGDYDFCDAKREVWIWSIGERISDKQVFASTTACFYQHPEYRCIWLR